MHMKRFALIVGVALMATVLSGVASGQGTERGRQDVYFGFLLGSGRVAAVAVDLGPPDRTGARVLRAYVCDGLGSPDGTAVWFKGSVNPDGVSNDSPLVLTSVSGNETLRIFALHDRSISGAFTEASGAASPFVSYPAIDGAGIYQVTLDETLRYTGTSTDGAVLDAQATSDGTTTGTITPAHGLALTSAVELNAHGFTTDYLDYAAVNQVPGSYVAVIAPGGSHWFGRSGAVTLGSPGVFIIGLDLCCERR
jgi:hypothetical protein